MAFPTIPDFSASFAHQILVKLIHHSCTLGTGSAFTLHCLLQRIKFIHRAEEDILVQSVCKTLLHNKQLFSKRKSKSHGREQRKTRTLVCLSQSFEPCFWQLRESIPQEISGTCARRSGPDPFRYCVVRMVTARNPVGSESLPDVSGQARSCVVITAFHDGKNLFCMVHAASHTTLSTLV